MSNAFSLLDALANATLQDTSKMYTFSQTDRLINVTKQDLTEVWDSMLDRLVSLNNQHIVNIIGCISCKLIGQ